MIKKNQTSFEKKLMESRIESINVSLVYKAPKKGMTQVKIIDKIRI